MKINIKQSLLALFAVPALALGAVGVFTAPAYAADCAATNGIVGSQDCAKPNNTPDNLGGDGGVFKTIANVLLFIIGAIAVIMLIIGGIRYVISQGDSSAVTSAKNTILYAVIGIIVAILAYAIVNFVIGSFATTA